MQDACIIDHSNTTLTQRIVTALFLAIMLGVAFVIMSELQLFPSLSNVQITLPIVFVLGIVASVSSCMATAGALFLTTIGTLKTDKLVPAALFNIGRVVTYGVFGFLLGLFGEFVQVNYDGGVTLTIFVSSIMILVALDMLGIISLRRITSVLPFTRTLWKVEGVLARKPRRMAGLLGAFTYFLPCGFSQTVQLFALGSGDPMYGLLLMTVFALGTVPALMFLSFSSFFTRTAWYPWFMRTVAVVIILVSVGYIANTANLYTGAAVASGSYQRVEGQVSFEDGYQVIRMDVLNHGYEPNTFNIQQGAPVKWIVNGINVLGCQGFLNVPKLGIAQTLAEGENVFEFTPTADMGLIGFSCSTNAMQGSFQVM